MNFARFLTHSNAANALQTWKSVVDSTPMPKSDGRYHKTPIELTKRELRVARLVKQEKSNPQIAAKLKVSERTVEGHLYQVLTKLGVNDRRDLRFEAVFDEKLADDEDNS